MRKRKVYMSVPMTLDWSSVQLFKRRFPEKEFQVDLWNRKEYFPHYFREAEAVVFLLPNWEFDYVISDLPAGVKREVKEAVATGKEIYIGYITERGDYNIYEAQVMWTTDTIYGKKGTANTIFKGTEGATMKVSLEEFGSDERLLLML